MAPEVIEHSPYNEKADVFSFGILLWELLTARVPYSEMTPLQAAVGVVQKGLRPQLPPSTRPQLSAIMRACWQRSPEDRPDFSSLKVGQLHHRPRQHCTACLCPCHLFALLHLFATAVSRLHTSLWQERAWLVSYLCSEQQTQPSEAEVS